MSSTNTHTDLPGRVLAFLVFLLGVGLLCLVFGLAWSLFRSPVPGLELPVRAGTAAPPAAGIGVALAAFARQVILLALMTLAGSIISGKGAQLYYSAGRGPDVGEASAGASRKGRAASGVALASTDGPVAHPPV